MSDIADDSDLIVDMFTRAAIKEASKDLYIQADGHCLFCDEAIAPDLRFCDRHCRDDWDAEQRMLKINGSRAG